MGARPVAPRVAAGLPAAVPEAVSVDKWDKFFCFSCTTSRPITLKVKLRNKVICAYCFERVKTNDASVFKHGGDHHMGLVRVVEPEPIPQSILESYQEAHAEY